MEPKNITPSSDQMVIISNEEENLLKFLQIPGGLFLNMVLKTAIELHLFDIIQKYGEISSHEIASHLPTENPNAPIVLERILMFLASESLLTCNVIKDENGSNKKLYSLTPLSKYLVSNKDGDQSLAPLLLLMTDPVFVNSWFHLKDAILEGEIPFNKAHGMHAYDEKDNRFNVVFNKAMQNVSCIEMKMILETYNGFQRVKEIVDVGGGLGVTIASILSKYPTIKGINFDLPHVVKDAPIYAGVEHVGGDMFDNIPKGEVIILKWILHNWEDDKCMKILKNCLRALPENGKVVIVDRIKSEYPETNLVAKNTFQVDMCMILHTLGKERTKEEFEILGKNAGFTTMKIVCRACFDWVIEFYK